MRLPEWLKVKDFRGLHGTKQILRNYGLSTVCEEARCPNRGECFAKPTATFMILGAACTRNCGFCAVDKASPAPVDNDEPARVAMAAREMGLKYVVITSVTRDDLKDGGASHFAKTVVSVRKLLPNAGIEILTPDFRGDSRSLKTVFDSRPDVFNHNIETVPRLYPSVRPQADYSRSIHVLRQASAAGLNTKSGLMLGLGETSVEVISVMDDLRSAGCDSLTIGQYLSPSKKNLPVKEYLHPEVFREYKDMASGMGFRFVASSPLTRSSMNAGEMFEYACRGRSQASK